MSEFLPADEVRYEKDRNEDFDINSPMDKQPNKLSKWGIWFIVLICLAVLVTSFLWVFSGTVVEITLKKLPINVDVEIAAKHTPGSGEISYISLPVVKTGEVSVPADGERKTDKKASGTIIIYNNYSSATQRLIKNTRFETGTGLIYRIQESIVVPGKKTVDGKVVPGSIEADVLADGSGTDYNIGLSDFTIPGFKDNSGKFAGFYARSKTSMTGGFSGIAKYASEEKINAARSALRADLEKELLAEAKSQAPENSVLYDNAHKMDFQSLPDTTGTDGVVIQEKATFNGYLFNKDVLFKYLAEQYVDKYDGNSVNIPELQDLTFDLRTRVEKTPSNDPVVLFGLKGKATIIWQFDQDKLVVDLGGQPKTDLDKILKKYPGIVKARAIIRPFWKNDFPTGSIKIVIEPDTAAVSSVNTSVSATSTNSN